MKTSRVFVVALATACGFGFALKAELVNGVKAVVHDSIITYGEVESDVLMIAGELQRQSGRNPQEYQRRLDAAFNDSFDKALQQQLILHDFKSSGYKIPDSIIDEVVLEEIRDSFGDRATLTKTLQARGITYEKWRQQARDRFIVRQLRLKNVYQETIISPHKIETYYTEHLAEYKVEEQVKLRTIVLNKSSEEEAEISRALAKEVLEKLKQGAAFSEMAGIYSQGSQRSQGGDSGWQARPDLRKEISDVAFGLKAGELSDVIETPEALFILLVEDKRSNHNRPLAEVRDNIEETLLKQERERLNKQYIEKLKKKTFVRQIDF